MHSRPATLFTMLQMLVSMLHNASIFTNSDLLVGNKYWKGIISAIKSRFY